MWKAHLYSTWHQLSWGLWDHFQGDSLTWLASWCWLFVGSLVIRGWWLEPWRLSMCTSLRASWASLHYGDWVEWGAQVNKAKNKKVTFYDLALEVTKCHYHWQPDLSGKNTDPFPWWEKCQNLVARRAYGIEHIVALITTTGVNKGKKQEDFL